MIRVLAVIMAFCAGGAQAQEVRLVAEVDISDQRMVVHLDGTVVHAWDVSTARAGKVTPRGTFDVDVLSRYHRSTLYDSAPMPYSIFFHGNYAIHGTTQVDQLGCPASAGCVRLHPDNAAILFQHVLHVGMAAARVVIHD